MALSLVRELGPVVAALLFAGRAGASLTAEIGLMRAGEQLTALEMMAVDPVQRILAPRFWGGIIALPLLAAVSNASTGAEPPAPAASKPAVRTVKTLVLSVDLTVWIALPA